MRRIIVGVISATLLLCCFGVAGGQVKNDDKDSSHPAFKVLNDSHANPNITLPELLDSYEKAVGGREAIQKIQTAEAYEERRAQSKEAEPEFSSSVEFFKFSNKAKNVSKDVFGYEGETVWHDRPKEGIQKRRRRELNVFAMQEFDLFSLLHLRTAFPQMTLVGSSKVEGRDVYMVDAPVESLGLHWSFFFDAETRLLIGGVVVQHTPDQILISEHFYSDFREVNGVKFPFVFRAFEHSSQSSLEIKVTRIKCNAPYEMIASQ